jgi:hypothetical protein
MSAAYDIATLLQAGSFGTVGTDIGANNFMDKGDNELAVFEFAGLPDDSSHGSVVSFENPRIQVQVRNTSASAGFQKCYDLYKFLSGKMDQTLNGHVYQLIETTSFPHLLIRDEQNRAIFLCEFVAHRLPE